MFANQTTLSSDTDKLYKAKRAIEDSVETNTGELNTKEQDQVLGLLADIIMKASKQIHELDNEREK